MPRKMLFVVLIGLALSTISFSTTQREDTQLNDGWRFKLGKTAGAEQPSFDDRTWQAVSIPHNWGWEEAQKGGTYYRGPGWYRRVISVGPPRAGKRYFLRFEAASAVADVYVNGIAVGQHRGAFGAFCFEITKQLSPSGNNVVAVCADNAPAPDLAPLSGDFSIFGGLYRPVHLIVTDNLCFALTDHASPGITWQETSVSADNAVLDVTAEISNGSSTAASCVLATVVYDAAGAKVAEATQNVSVPAGFTAPFYSKLRISSPHLWNGRPDPYLYRAVAELRTLTGAVTDAVEQQIGLRSYRIDPEKGFFLNGKPYALHGVNRHQDRANKGWAISEDDMLDDMRLIKEIGCTVLRCAHYQHSDYFYSLCDAEGILVWAELAQVNAVNSDSRFAETSRGQLLDLIRQNVNHPSIFVWSLFNEIWPGGADPHRELQDLQAVAKGEDPTRLTIAATATMDLPQMNKIPDLLGWNMYPGWYSSWGSISEFGKALDDRKFTSRDGGFCVSEYGAGANTLQHEQNPPQPKADGQWHPEEYQSIVHEGTWEVLKSKPYVWATFVWNMFDFTSDKRNEGAVPGRNDKGLVTYDRSIKKDAFYFYKANWTDEPVLMITDKRFTERMNAVTDVKAYSNAGSVELFVNNVSQGVQTSDGNGVFVWKEVKLVGGTNQIDARAKGKDWSLVDGCSWTLGK